MKFEELKEKIKDELNLQKPDFLKDSETTVNIGQIDLGPTQQLIFSISTFRDKNYFDIRTWFQDQSGEWKPTKKGIHFTFEKFKDFEKHLKTFSDISSMDK